MAALALTLSGTCHPPQSVCSPLSLLQGGGKPGDGGLAGKLEAMQGQLDRLEALLRQQASQQQPAAPPAAAAPGSSSAASTPLVVVQ